jgi:hypothetical protein
MTKAKAMARYLEARRDVTTLRKQLVAFPELAESRPWKLEFDSAVVLVHEYQRCLTGGQIGAAERVLRGEATS